MSAKTATKSAVKHVDAFAAEPVSGGRATTRQVLIGPDVGPNFAMRRFIMEPGGGMPLHTNEVEHEQYVLRGSARVRIGDDVHHVKAGDVVYIPGGTPHSYDADAGDEPFEFLCIVPNRPDQIRMVDC
jgi:quercetin dioxygenase-like cupin family protein